MTLHVIVGPAGYEAFGNDRTLVKRKTHEVVNV
jgi:hypothetical protein